MKTAYSFFFLSSSTKMRIFLKFIFAMLFYVVGRLKIKDLIEMKVHLLMYLKIYTA